MYSLVLRFIETAGKTAQVVSLGAYTITHYTIAPLHQNGAKKGGICGLHLQGPKHASNPE